MGEITRLLTPDDGGSPDLDAVFEHVYPELKRLARIHVGRMQPGQTLTPTVLVSEAYVKLVRSDTLEVADRRHFFCCAARAMRHIVIDSIRASVARKRGGDLQAVTLNEEHLALARTPQQLLDLDSALDELGRMSPRQRELVELKFFAGLPMREIATLIELSERSAWREWQRARAFLHAHLQR